MANRIIPITVAELPVYTGLDGANADNYYRAGERRAFLSAEVMHPFRDALRDETGYSDENIPEKAVEKPINVGSFTFVAQVTPTTKRPGYKDVFDELKGYLKAMLAEYKTGHRPQGILTLDDEPYISAVDVLKRLGKAKRKVTSTGISIELTDPDMPDAPSSIVVPLGADLGKLSEGNAQRYLASKSMSERYKAVMDEFEDGLLGLTGFSDEHMPAATEDFYAQMGSHIFHVASVPYASTSYGKVVSCLDKEPGKRNPETGGDLVLATMGIDAPRLRVYDTKRRDEDCLVKLKALLNRMDRLVEENTETKLRQRPINHYPVV